MSIPYDDALVMFRMLTVLMSLLCYAHISACMQFMIPMITGFDHDTWVVIRGLEDANFSTQYGFVTIFGVYGVYLSLLISKLNPII